MENGGRGKTEEGTRGRIGKGSTRVEDVMTRKVITLRPDQTFADVVNLMAKHSFRHFPVVESPARLVGVISDRDILRALHAPLTGTQAMYVSLCPGTWWQ